MIVYFYFGMLRVCGGAPGGKKRTTFQTTFSSVCERRKLLKINT